MTKKGVTNLSYMIVGCAIKVHKELGPDLLESVYEKCLKFELEAEGFNVKQQQKVPIMYRNNKIEADLRIDLLVEDCIIVKLKAVEKVNPIYEAQLLTYMKLLKKPQGLLINFFTRSIADSMVPLVNEHFKKLH